MNRPFNTEDCAFCYVSMGVWTGCNASERKAGERAKCSKCGSLLPPKGEIIRIKYLSVLNSMSGNFVADGHMAKIKRASDGEEEWYLIHARGGKEGKLFPHIGKPSMEIKAWLDKNNLICKWPIDPILKIGNTLVPFSRAQAL